MNSLTEEQNQSITNTSRLLVCTLFQEEFVALLYGMFDSIQVFDCSKSALTKRLESLRKEELDFLFIQSTTIVFTNVDRLASSSNIIAWCKANENAIQVIAVGQSTTLMKGISASMGTHQVHRFTLPKLSDYLKEDGIIKTGENIKHWLVQGMARRGMGNYEHQNNAWYSKHKLHRVNKPEIMDRMLCFLAMNALQTLGYNEIGAWCGIDNETAQRYIDLLIDYGVIYLLRTYSTKNKYEYIKGIRVGFTDNYLLNYYKSNLSPFDRRADVLDLWKNWLISERMKLDISEYGHCSYTFWQSHTRQNIDLLIADAQGNKQAFVFSWHPKKKILVSPLFLAYYPTIPVHIVTLSNYLSFVTR
ncbi:MAG: DUF4143 domain-containing protein [Flavobacteriia bacterium]|nr:DUF4143 domain-containing protein [Flavobacteriia bacterium]